MPKKARRPKAPIDAIKCIVEAHNDPDWKVTRGDKSPFGKLCSIVFDAASGGKLRSGKNSTYLGAGGSENRPDIDRAIRGYKKQLAPKAGAD